MVGVVGFVSFFVFFSWVCCLSLGLALVIGKRFKSFLLYF